MEAFSRAMRHRARSPEVLMIDLLLFNLCNILQPVLGNIAVSLPVLKASYIIQREIQ